MWAALAATPARVHNVPAGVSALVFACLPAGRAASWLPTQVFQLRSFLTNPAAPSLAFVFTGVQVEHAVGLRVVRLHGRACHRLRLQVRSGTFTHTQSGQRPPACAMYVHAKPRASAKSQSRHIHTHTHKQTHTHTHARARAPPGWSPRAATPTTGRWRRLTWRRASSCWASSASSTRRATACSRPWSAAAREHMHAGARARAQLLHGVTGELGHGLAFFAWGRSA